MRRTAVVACAVAVLAGGCSAPSQQVAMGVNEARSSTASIALHVELVTAGRTTHPVARTAVDADVTELVAAQSRVEEAAVTSEADARVQDEAADAVAQALAAARHAKRVLDSGSDAELDVVREQLDLASGLLDRVTEAAGPPR